MPLSPTQERYKYKNNVPSIPSRTITFASSARGRAFTPALHHTTPLFIVSIASTLFIALYKTSETKSNAAVHAALSVLVHLSLLFSLLGALSAAPPSRPVPKTAHKDQSAFNERPEACSAAVVVRSQVDVCMPDVQRRSPVPPWLFAGSWDRPSIYAFTGVSCFTALVWLSLCMYLPWGVQVVNDTAAAVCTVALRRLRTTSRFVP